MKKLVLTLFLALNIALANPQKNPKYFNMDDAIYNALLLFDNPKWK